MLVHLLCMTNGQTALTDLQDARYPDLALESFATSADHALSAKTAA